MNVRTHRRAALMVDRMSERRASSVGMTYTRAILDPLRSIVDDAAPTGVDATDAQGLLRLLDASVLVAFDNADLAMDMTAHLMQASAVGAATIPRVAGQDVPVHEDSRT